MQSIEHCAPSYSDYAHATPHSRCSKGFYPFAQMQWPPFRFIYARERIASRSIHLFHCESSLCEIMDAAPDPRVIPSFPSENAQQHAHAFAGATIALHGLAFIVFAGRMWSRSYPVLRMYLDDYVCILAYVRRTTLQRMSQQADHTTYRFSSLLARFSCS
jgi:hypothetical protein